jgi:hypothetical protein
MMVEYYDASFASLHVRVSNRAALYMYKDNLKFEILGIEKGYYADKEDAYKMKKFFKPADKEKEKSKIIEISSDVKWEDIMDTYEEVDINGEEKEKASDADEEKKKEADEKIVSLSETAKEEDKKKKKKKGKKNK